MCRSPFCVLPRGCGAGMFRRIKKLEEVYDMGYEDYFYSGALCFIEWPELVEELLPGNTIKVTIEEVENGERKVTLENFE